MPELRDIFYCELGKVFSSLNYFVNQNIHVIITKEEVFGVPWLSNQNLKYRVGVRKGIIAIWLDNWICCMKLLFFFFFTFNTHTVEFLSSRVTDYRIPLEEWREKRQ